MNAFLLVAGGCLAGFLTAFFAFRSRAHVMESQARGLAQDLAAAREEIRSLQEQKDGPGNNARPNGGAPIHNLL